MGVGVVFAVVLVGIGGLVMTKDHLRRLGTEMKSMVRGNGSRDKVDDQRAVVEAVATWTENLRDTMSAASGIEQALVSTADHAPSAIAPAVRRLVASIRYGTLEDGLRGFADDVRHPACDFVVAALITSAEHQTRDVASLLGHLAGCARAECDLYMRVWVSRARTRASTRIISAAVGIFVLGLLALNPRYLAPFFSSEGTVVLLADVAVFASALRWLHAMADVKLPGRFLHGRAGAA